MNREREIYKQVCILGLVGLGLFGIVLFAPDASRYQNGSFWKVAFSTSWHSPLDFPAAWCSLKIILLSLGLFLLIESLGTVLSLLKYKSVALMIYFLQMLPCLGFLVGGYYLVKALL
jgi:hypothetical protein